jgi:2-phosphosulfolactate phosphatase
MSTAVPEDVRVEWGSDGLSALLPMTDVVVIVDVLSFSTCVDVALSRGAAVLPFPEGGDAAAAFATRAGAACAGPRGQGRFSLSPTTFTSVEPGARVVLPSMNGGALAREAGAVPALTACLRNAPAVARAAQRLGGRITVIAAGERWPSGRLRPALEDWLGAGAVVQALAGRRSREADAASHAFEAAAARVRDVLAGCASGRQLIEAGFQQDVLIAADYDVSACAPVLRDGAFEDGRS